MKGQPRLAQAAGGARRGALLVQSSAPSGCLGGDSRGSTACCSLEMPSMAGPAEWRAQVTQMPTDYRISVWRAKVPFPGRIQRLYSRKAAGGVVEAKKDEKPSQVGLKAVHFSYVLQD